MTTNVVIGIIRVNERCADFDLLKAKLELFNNLEDVKSQPPYLQQELCELQLDPFLLSKKIECCNQGCRAGARSQSSKKIKDLELELEPVTFKILEWS